MISFSAFSLPNWAEEIMTDGDMFEYLASQQFLSNTRTTELKRLYAGFLLKEIFDRSAYKALSPTSVGQTMWMYFAHDSTIAGVLNTLGVFEVFSPCTSFSNHNHFVNNFILLQPHQPAYTSCVFFEMYRANEPYLKIFYKNSSEIKNILPLTIPNCGEKCPLDDLNKIYEEVLPTDSFEDECELRDGETLEPDESEEIDIFEEFANFFEIFE